MKKHTYFVQTRDQGTPEVYYPTFWRANKHDENAVKKKNNRRSVSGKTKKPQYTAFLVPLPVQISALL